MKTNHILTLLAGAALMLSSCVNESELNYGGDKSNLKKDEIGFKMGVTQVRSEAKVEGQTIQLATLSSTKGSLILEDQVESLDGAMATRGTPVYTANAEKVHTSFYAVGSGSGKDFPDAEYKFDTDDEFWKHHYAGMGELWDGDVSYQFFMRMPGNVPGVTNGAAGITNNASDGSMTFDYVSPSRNATGQTDILFTSATVTENGSDITFYHALTGVKFSNYFDNKGITAADGSTKITTKTIIKQVKITGLKKAGHCVVTPAANAKSKDAVVWSGQKDTMVFFQSFGDNGDTTNYANSTVGLDTLLQAGSKVRNLNDKDGTMTFWFVPQSLAKTETDSVTISVTFDVFLENRKTFSDTTMTITLSDYLADAHKTWQPGELHTFTLRPTAIKVKIHDEMGDYEKKNVVVKNEGNVWQYVRVNLIGNWVGDVCTGMDEDNDGTLDVLKDVILMGRATPTAEKYVNQWNDKDVYEDGTYREVKATSLFDQYPTTGYGTFVGLPYMFDDRELEDDDEIGPGGRNILANGQEGNWIRHDKYYYYMLPIGPGDSVTETLFQSYTVGVSPTFWIVDKMGVMRQATNVHLEMDVAVQAIEALMKPNGDEALENGYLDAWTAVLNEDNDPDFNINDL